MELKIIGKPTSEVIESYQNVLRYNRSNTSEVILFCDYSEFDIPVDQTFNYIENTQGKKVYSDPFTLVNISQEFGLPFDIIPRGYKTICKFSFIGKIPPAIKEIPTIKTWHEASVCLVLK